MPSGGGLTLRHVQEDEPECMVVLGGGRVAKNGSMDNRRIKLIFTEVYFARVGYHRDNETIEAIGYRIEDGYTGPEDVITHCAWADEQSLAKGVDPHSGFYFASESDWQSKLKLPEYFWNPDFQHYVIDDRDGYIELISKGFSWKEWMWDTGHRDAVVGTTNVVASGTGQV